MKNKYRKIYYGNWLVNPDGTIWVHKDCNTVHETGRRKNPPRTCPCGFRRTFERGYNVMDMYKERFNHQANEDNPYTELPYPEYE